MPYKIGVISLGCAKNTVDTEVMLGILEKEGHIFVKSFAEADIALINTCGFITDAKEEAINAILEAEQQKRFGNLKAIIVTGCLSERYKRNLQKLLPRVDAFLGVAADKDIANTVYSVMSGKKIMDFKKPDLSTNFTQRLITTSKPTAYVKIAEGCNNKCSYCIIPSIRGGYTSRAIEDIIEEIKSLTDQGYSEIILVAQDTTKYGIDLYNKPRLQELLERAAQINGVRLLRILYFYPDETLITKDLLITMAEHPNIAKYIDMPIQHTDDVILKAMNRKHTYANIMEIIDRIRGISNNFIIRSTVMVGFPGETKQNYKKLKNDLISAKFNNLGVFTYSQEEDTPASLLCNQVVEDEKRLRKNGIMNIQGGISYELNKKLEGAVLDTLVEQYSQNKNMYIGRSYAQIPEVDGSILIKSDKKLILGNFYPVKMKQAYSYDIEGEVL